jgi:uncharacterized membrane protein YccC
MTETILLFILAIVIFLAILAIRHYRTPEVISPRIEAIIRIALCLLAALVAHALYAAKGEGFGFVVAVVAGALLCYAGTHLPDRLLVKG